MTYGGGTATATSSPPCRVVVRPPLPPKSTQLVELAAVRKSQIVQELEESGRISQVQQQPNCTEGVIERKQPPQTRPPMHNANLIAQRKEFFHQLSQDRLGRDGGIEKVLQRRPSWTAYVDVGISSPSVVLLEEEALSSLTHAESLLSKLSVEKDSKGENARRSVSEAIDILKKSTPEEQQQQQEEEGKSHLSSPKSSREFNLYKAESRESVSTTSKSAAEDTGYLSCDSDNSTGFKAKVKDFLWDNFGRSPPEKQRGGRPTSPLPRHLAAIFSEAGAFIADKRVVEDKLLESDRIDPIDQKMFEKAPSSDATSSSSASTAYDEEDEVSAEVKQQRKVYNIAKEMMTSEREFVNVLKLLNVEFIEYLEEHKTELPNAYKGTFDAKLFNNLMEIQIFNSDLLKDFEQRVENWDREKKIADVIVRKGAFLMLYSTYVHDFQQMTNKFNDLCDKHPSFARLVKDFESREQCRGLKLEHFMLKPVQRLPQYKLLLETYLKNLSPESEDYDNATQALSIVTRAAEHANEKIQQDDNFKRLLRLQSRLGETDLVQANRVLIREGEISKICRAGVSQRYLVLCNDCLIYAKISSSTSLKAAYKIPLSTLQVSLAANAGEFPLDFDIKSPVRSCTFQAATNAERDTWFSAIEKAVEEHKLRKASYAQFAADITNSVILKLGESAPIWVPDERVTMCQKCYKDFTLLIRRHHCRACGQVVCANCSSGKAPLKYRSYDASRVCDSCYAELYAQMKADGVMSSMIKGRFKKESNGAHASGAKKNKYPAGVGQMTGYLHRKGRKSGSYKKLWYVLKDRVLYEFRAPADAVASQTCAILGFDLDLVDEIPAELMSVCKNGKGFTLSHVGVEPLTFFSENEITGDKWIKELIDSVSF